MTIDCGLLAFALFGLLVWDAVVVAWVVMALE